MQLGTDYQVPMGEVDLLIICDVMSLLAGGETKAWRVKRVTITHITLGVCYKAGKGAQPSWIPTWGVKPTANIPVLHSCSKATHLNGGLHASSRPARPLRSCLSKAFRAGTSYRGSLQEGEGWSGLPRG